MSLVDDSTKLKILVVEVAAKMITESVDHSHASLYAYSRRAYFLCYPVGSETLWLRRIS